MNLSLYSKQELIALLEEIYTSGIGPFVEGELTPAPTDKPGSTAEQRQMNWKIFVHTLTENYPNPISLKWLASATCIGLVTLKRWQENPAHFTRLPDYLSTYFRSLAVGVGVRLSPAWRAVLDLHYYKLMLDNPQIALPLYEHHLVMWGGGAVNPDRATVGRLNHIHRARIFSEDFTQVLTDADWRLPQAITETWKSAKLLVDYPCHRGCPVAGAFVYNQELWQVEQARALVGKLPWLPAKQSTITGKTALAAVRQIVGV